MNSSQLASHISNEPRQRIVSAEVSKFQNNSVSFPFKFSLNLVNHPLFQIPRLLELRDFVTSQNSHNSCSIVKGEISANCQKKHSGRYHANTIAPTKAASLLVLINDAQVDSEYQALLDQIIDELEELSGNAIRQRSFLIDACLFITSPDSIKKGSINGEANFLFRLSGEKRVCWDEQQKVSFFISLVYFPKEPQIVNLHLFTLESSISGGAEIKSRSNLRPKTFRRSERNRPPQPNAKLGRDPQGNPAWFIADPNRPGKYLYVGEVS